MSTRGRGGGGGGGKGRGRGRKRAQTLTDTFELMVSKERERAYLVPWMRLYLWEFKFGIVWIHTFYLLPGRCSQDLHSNLNTWNLILRLPLGLNDRFELSKIL